jgi:hypothetical protein
MTPEQRTALETERTDLSRKLSKREGEHGFSANVAAIRVRLAEIDAELSGG